MSVSRRPDVDVIKVSVLNAESIIAGFHLTDYMLHDILTNITASTYAIVTDNNVASFHLSKLTNRFDAIAAEVVGSRDAVTSKPRLLTFVIPPGEQSKSRPVKDRIEDFLLDHACTRDTCILAMGGGVIGDLVGFVAATFMRGVPFVQIPTTLLAMVDSSIGGKTAVDTPHGKNLIGAFWQPRRTFIDLSYLETLPEREFTNGMAEVIKTAAFWSEKDFVDLENGTDSIRDAVLNPSKDVENQGATLATRTPAQSLLLSVVLASVKVKAHVVTHDERESGLRMLLNFGHSIGHAIEAILSPEMLHGECIAIGMIKEAEISRNLGYINQAAVGRLTRCLQSYGLPISLEEKRVLDLVGSKHCSVDKLMEIMKVDKKNQGDKKRIVLLSAIGKTHEQKASFVADSVIRKVLSPAIKTIPPTPSSRPANFEVTTITPGSKSISNRVLVLAALGSGICRIRGLLHSDDTQVMLVALQKLGAAQFQWEDNGDTLVVTGSGGQFHVPDSELYLGNAGTAARFLTTVCTLVSPDTATATRKHTILTGNHRMKLRPISPLVTTLRENGVGIRYLEREGSLPLEITPSPHRLRGGNINLAASISSQYVSSVLMCAPYASEPVILKLTGGQVISQQFIDMTIAMMESFGVKVERLEGDVYRIPQGSYKNPPVYVIESDASSASYPLAIAAITGTTCTIPNIGASSLQGDAEFAVKVLRPMGCSVTQTATSTTVQGPPVGSLRPLPQIDMERMTDAFLTAAVLAAVARDPETGQNVTRITGIANQRVKECNRIAAMVSELSKFGVKTSELPDGIEIHGAHIDSLKAPTEGVDCYDDHRIAMSFSVLGCVVPGDTLIRDKKCVEKTWPEWWDYLESKLHVELVGADLEPSNNLRQRKPAASEASIVLIGMRGVGKTMLGQAAAKALNRQFLDMDPYFEAALSTTIPEFVKTHGWEDFRVKETELFARVLKEHRTGYVIACGGGIVETTSARDMLKEYFQQGGIVLHVSQDIEVVIAFLNSETTRPPWGEEIRDVWGRREKWYKECSNYEFGVPTVNAVDENSKWRKVENDLVRLLKFITGRETNHVDLGSGEKRTFFLSLTFPNVEPALEHLPTLTHGVDAIELRADLLSLPDSGAKADTHIQPSLEYVAQQVAMIRHHSDLPIIFTLRSQNQGGRFPDNAEQKAYELLEHGMKWGCEYVDIEVGWSPIRLTHLLKRKGNSKIIASWHDTTGDIKWDSTEMEQRYRTAHGYGDIVKVIGRATSFEDNFALQSFVASRSLQPGTKPTIAINMGGEGQLSRTLNQIFTPVTHPLLPSKAAPGQLSVADIHRALHLIGLLPKRKFFLFGTPIKASPSPLMHNTGFEMLGMPHHYDIFESEDVGAVKPVIMDPEFGGASVTIPHKISIMQFLDELSEHAKRIGSVNTVIPRYVKGADGKLVRKLLGDNTDWLGILHCIRRALGTNESLGQSATGLVVGAGGTSRAAVYALHHLGVGTIYLYNRTTEKAVAFVTEFPDSYNLKVLPTLATPVPVAPQVIISTVPASANIDYPDAIFGFTASGSDAVSNVGVVVEMAYRPRRTKLLQRVDAINKSGITLRWVCVEGVEVLVEQGLFQFMMWTGRRAPRNVITERVFAQAE